MATYIDAEELASMIKNPANRPGTDYLVVDVRDEDFVGGNIPGAKNIPSSTFLQDVESQVADLAGPTTLIFHCALSQMRGPSCAIKYQRAKEQIGSSTPQRILVLRGGFTDWQVKYRNDPQLVERFNSTLWN